MTAADWSIEANLYPHFRVWQNLSFQLLDVRGDHITADVANRRQVRGRYQTPDFLRFDLPNYRFSRVQSIVVTSFELKTRRASVNEVSDQVRAHTKFSNYSWAVVHDWSEQKIDNLRNDAMEFGFGLIQIPPDPRSNKYIVGIEPEFHAIPLDIIDSLVLGYLGDQDHKRIEAWLSK